jgi:pimeloyl-ACP methyl ester carboxylesterase
LICPDLRGAGWTEAPRDGYTRTQLLTDVVNLLDALKLDRVRLIGHDWGALLGFQLCLRHPPRVRSFLSLAVPHPYVKFSPRMIPSMRHAWYQLPIATPGINRRVLSEGKQPLPRFLFRAYASNRTPWNDGDIEFFLAPLRNREQSLAAAKLYRHFIQPEAKAIMTGAYRNQRLTTPTHLLVGADDPVAKAEFLGGWEDFADDVTVETVDGAAHWIADERPDIVVQRARELFARC